MNTKEYSHNYYLKHREKIRERSHLYYLQHPEYRKRMIENRCRYYQENKEKVRESERKRRRKVSIKVLTHYGKGKLACVKCGFSDPRALCIDHINSDGAKQRRELSIGSGYKFHRRLVREGYPNGHQTLCSNCNLIKQRGAFIIDLTEG